MSKDCVVVGCLFDSSSTFELETEIGMVKVPLCEEHVNEAIDL